MFVADVRLPGLQDIAFVRSQIAHGRITSITKPADSQNRVFTIADFPSLNVLEAGPELDAFRQSPYPALASDKVRYVGQAIAACIATTRARAEDLAELVEVECAELPAVVNAIDAMSPGSARLFENWADNAYIARTISAGDMSLLKDAPIRLHRRFRMNRQATVSLETRGVVAHWDARLEELVVHLSTQGGHVMRLGLARALGLPENQIRVIAPDVGGGFGGKNRLLPEEIAVCAIALKVGHPVRWIEDRREHLLASVHCRDHHYDLTVTADSEGRLLGIEGDVYIDAGAYALWPTGSFMEASMAAGNLPGPYRVKALSVNTFTVATNKAPMGPYRGVARPGACFAIERLVDEVALHMGIEPYELRKRNLVTREEMPFVTVAGLKLDTGDYHDALDTAAAMVDIPAVRRRQAARRAGEPRVGVGFAVYTEQSGHGVVEWSKRKSRVVPGYESANVRMLPDGSVVIHVGVQNHGQGHETTLAQIAAHELSLDPSQIKIRYGDTSTTPFGFGTFASRTIVFAGGAVGTTSRRLAEKIRLIGAHFLQADPKNVHIEDGHVVSQSGSVAFREIALAANIRQEMLPEGMDPSLDMTGTYEPTESAGVFSYGTHAVVVEVDESTGGVKILDYAVSEDCGTMINPMIVDGQVQGGIAQGIGTGLYEEIPFNADGQPLATTFADYMMPCATEIPTVRIAHSVTPAKVTEYGVKGVGEGGAIAPPAALANAVADAFRDCKASFNETPLTPRRVWDAVQLARASERAAS
ncbi:MAG: xanthine dehydrogenase, molybdenum binding subunit apoprotein [Hyphomicrobiales bacterium]|nr:xanthine dehydrogenase, molybdenum binding subunit apoprotein [Hyphomicrobiales bacterium]